jgi:hypothetical protein
LCGPIGSERFAEVFDNEAGLAESSDEVFPPVQELDGSLFAVGLIGHFRQRPFVVVLDPDDISIASVAVRDLEAGGLFVLTDVKPVVSKDTSDLSKHRFQRGDIAGADGLMNDIEGFVSERREVIHGSLDDIDLESSFFGFAAVDGQHIVADVDDGDACSGGGVENRLPATGSSEAEHIESLHACWQPASTVEYIERFGEFSVSDCSRELAARLDHPVPCRLVVTQEFGSGSGHGEVLVL